MPEPMTMLAIGSAIAGGLSSIFGGRAQSAAQAAAVKQQNEQAYRNWLQSVTQTSVNNARQHFQAAYAATQQTKRNSAIMRSAWENQWEAKQALDYRTGYQQNQLSQQMTTQQATLANAVMAKGISSSSGAMAALSAVQAMDALKNARMIEYNAQQERANIDRQTTNALSQMTENIFMPNIQLYDQPPVFGTSSNAAAQAGLISGLVQIGGAFAAAGMSGGQTPMSEYSPDFVGPPRP